MKCPPINNWKSCNQANVQFNQSQISSDRLNVSELKIKLFCLICFSFDSIWFFVKMTNDTWQERLIIILFPHRAIYHNCGLLQRLPLTRTLKGFFLRFKPAFWCTSINRYHGFSRVGLEKILSPFLEHSEEYVGVSAVFAIFCCRIWHRFMSRLRGERICWVFLGGNSNYRHIYTL